MDWLTAVKSCLQLWMQASWRWACGSSAHEHTHSQGKALLQYRVTAKRQEGKVSPETLPSSVTRTLHFSSRSGDHLPLPIFALHLKWESLKEIPNPLISCSFSEARKEAGGGGEAYIRFRAHRAFLARTQPEIGDPWGWAERNKGARSLPGATELWATLPLFIITFTGENRLGLGLEGIQGPLGIWFRDSWSLRKPR